MVSGRASLADSFYRRLGDGHYESTAATAGPWSQKTQHGGPPSALLGRAIEQHEPREGLRIGRITLEILRPVPVNRLLVDVHTIHIGKRTDLIEGVITSNGQPVVLGRAWRIAVSPEDTPILRPQPSPPPIPVAQPPHGMAGAYLDGYISAMEWRFTFDSGFDISGPGTAWARQRIPLVADEEDTPLTRALTLADSSWAIASELDHVRKLVINTDVTLALHREPVGEWLCVRSATAASPNGSGLALGQLDDTVGDCGRVLQTLLVAER